MANVVTLQVSQKDTVYPGATIDVNLAQVQQIWPLDDDTDYMLRFANGEQLRVEQSERFAVLSGRAETDVSYALRKRVGSFECYEYAGTIDAYKPRLRWVNMDLVRWVRPTHQPGVFEIAWALGGEPLLVHKLA